MNTKLTQIDKENWRFILYESIEGKWFTSFSYSPSRAVDLSMFIELNEQEKARAKSDRNFLIELSESIKNNHQTFLSRSLNTKNFEFKK